MQNHHITKTLSYMIQVLSFTFHTTVPMVCCDFTEGTVISAKCSSIPGLKAQTSAEFQSFTLHASIIATILG